MAQYPSAANTGVPVGVTLTPYVGDLEITQAGTVISGLDIHGTIYIQAPNVTIENCKITSANFAVIWMGDGATGAVVENCEINGVGTGNDGDSGILGEGTFLNNNIYNVENGIAVTGSSTIVGNYIHDLLASGSPHYDGIQIDGGVSNVIIRHNTIINSHTQTSAIMIDNGFGPISNIQVDDNVLVGGGYTVYSDATQSSSKSNPITGVSFTNNHIGGGYWGPTAFDNNTPIYTGNVNDGVALASILSGTINVSFGQTSTGVVVSGGLLNVLSGGTALSSILSGGNEVTFYGGLASGTVVNSGGVEVVSFGGTDSGTVVNSGGDQYVSGGGTALGGSVNDGGNQYVLSGGTASGTFVNGPGHADGLCRRSGGGGGRQRRHSTCVWRGLGHDDRQRRLADRGDGGPGERVGGDSNGEVYVSAGGTLSGAQLSGGFDLVFGTAVGTTILAGGLDYDFGVESGTIVGRRRGAAGAGGRAGERVARQWRGRGLRLGRRHVERYHAERGRLRPGAWPGGRHHDRQRRARS